MLKALKLGPLILNSDIIKGEENGEIMNFTKQNKKPYYLFIILFFVLNIFNTYFLTAQILNRYISPLKRSVIGEINAFFGNFSILLFIYLIIVLIFKSDKNRFRAMLYATGILNLFIFAISFYTYFYSSIFTFKSLDIFRNPAESVSGGLFTLALSELFINFKILIFVPTLVLLIVFYIYKKRGNLDFISGGKTLKNKLILLLTFILVFFGASLTYYQQVQDKDYFNIKSLSATNAVQNYGVYPFYLTELLGINFESTTRASLGIENNEQLVDRYMKYNKNQEIYQNFIDGNYYSNQLLLRDSYIDVDDSLNLSLDDSLTGIFKNKNLIYVHLESINYFLLEIEDVRERFTFLNQLLEQSVVFENYYTSVGMGVSSDAEFSALTGLYPNGYSTVYWDYAKKDLEFDTLPKLFNNKGYKTMPIHADFKEFYNRDKAYPEFMGFSEGYLSLDYFAEKAGYDDPSDYLKDNIKYGRDYLDNGLLIKTPWTSEFLVHELMYEKIEELDSKVMMYPVHISAHTPFLSNPYENQEYHFSNYNKLSKITKRYLEYAKYYDDVIKSSLFNLKDNSSYIDSNNVYVFYSDHGSSLKNGDLSYLYDDREISILEERRLLQQTLAFIYAPSDQVLENGLNKGLITGKQKLARSHHDLYRTIGDLFDLFDDSNPYFGTHGLSNEPSYVFDNRIQDIIIDDVNNMNNEGYKPIIVSFRNERFIEPYNYEISNKKRVYENIKEFKKLGDLLLNDATVYKDFKNALQKSLKNI